jgi:hypothetical protein
MAQLAQAIAHLNEQEISANEQALASCFPPPPELSGDTKDKLAPFLMWCQQQRVRAIPAKVTTICAYVTYQQDQGISRTTIAERLDAIESLHFAALVGNPCANPLVRTITAASTIEAPRSWGDKEAKRLFAQLPVEMQAQVALREQDRETRLRRSQNEAADLRRLLKTAAETKPVETQKKEDTTMAKWNGEQGSSDMEKDPLVQGTGPFKAPEWRQIKEGKLGPAPDLGTEIYDRADRASQIDDGYSGKLPKGPKNDG